MAIMNLPPACRTGIIKRMRIVEGIDNYTGKRLSVFSTFFLTGFFLPSFIIIIFPNLSLRIRYILRTDVIHIELAPTYVYPTWLAPRDFCLMRYWKHNADGSYIVCLDSTFHQDCPVVPGCVRGDLHGAYLISSPKVSL